MEHASVVELLDDLRADARQFGEIVRSAARSGEQFETLGRDFGGDLGFRRQFDGDRRLLGAEIDAKRALAAGNAVQRRAGDQVAIERDGAAGVVIAGDREGDAVRIAIGVENGRDRDVQALGFLDRQLLLVGVPRFSPCVEPGARSGICALP